MLLFPGTLRPEPGQRLAARTLPRGLRMSDAATALEPDRGQGLASTLRWTSRPVALLTVLSWRWASLAALIADVWPDGAGRLSWDFLTSFPSRRGIQAGIWHALTGSIVVMLVTASVAVPIGVGAAIYLEEYGSRSVARAHHRDQHHRTWRRCRRSSTACSAWACSCGPWTWAAACWPAPRRWRCSSCRRDPVHARSAARGALSRMREGPMRSAPRVADHLAPGAAGARRPAS